MVIDVLVYFFLFLALFFESFLLVTFLSRPARRARALVAPGAPTLSVAIIVPVWNEEKTVEGTVRSLLELDYPVDKLSIVLVNDGSTDTTPALIDQFATHPQITALHKENGGKFTAMNLGLAHVRDAELVGFLDADSFVAPDALKEIVASFVSPNVMASTASMSIHEPRTLLQKMQYAEYTLGIIGRHVLGSINGLYVTPGPFSFYRREVFEKLGYFTSAHLTEDMEMAMRIQRAGYEIGNALKARVYTKGPPTLPRLVKQRTRWTTGFLRNLSDYRDLIRSPRNSVLGLFVLPLAALAVGGGSVLFIMSVYEFIRDSLHSLSVVSTVPLSYTFSLHPLSWYDVPVTAFVLLGVVLYATTFVWMYVGKELSRTPGRLAPSILAYTLLYWVVAPLWLVRSVAEVAVRANTTWR